MRRKIFTGIGLIGIALVASIHGHIGMKNINSFYLALENIESLAGCETTSTPGGNWGICVGLLDSGGAACIHSIYEPNCCGAS